MTEGTAEPWIVEVDEATFEERVLAASHSVPVLVDFWAEWCGPCRYLGPILENAVTSFRGQVHLAKIDTDRNLNLAQRYRIQTIPNVKAFKKGAVVSEFVGVLPEPAIRQFVTDLLPTKADELVDRAAEAEQANRLDDALRLYREALIERTDHASAGLGELRLLVSLGRWDEAAAAYERMPGPQQLTDAVIALKARIDLAPRGDGLSRAVLEQRVASHPDDLDARFELAARYAAEQRYREALDAYVAILAKNRDYKHGAARKMMLQIFEVVGPRSPIADEYRERLARIIY